MKKFWNDLAFFAGGVLFGSVLGGTVTLYAVIKAMDDEEDDALVEQTTKGLLQSSNFVTEVKTSMKEYSGISSLYSNDTDTTDEYKYTISGDDLGESGYEVVNLRMYSDGHLVTDDRDERIIDAEEFLGLNNLSKVSEFDKGWLYVRNEENETDYSVKFINEPYLDVSDKVDDS